MPSDCFDDPDYQEVLGDQRPNVLPLSESLYARKLTFRCGVEYTVELWVP